MLRVTRSAASCWTKWPAWRMVSKVQSFSSHSQVLFKPPGNRNGSCKPWICRTGAWTLTGEKSLSPNRVRCVLHKLGVWKIGILRFLGTNHIISNVRFVQMECCVATNNTISLLGIFMEFLKPTVGLIILILSPKCTTIIGAVDTNMKPCTYEMLTQFIWLSY